MSNVGAFDGIKTFDLYKRLPKDLVQPTFSGAISNFVFIFANFCLHLFYDKFYSLCDKISYFV